MIAQPIPVGEADFDRTLQEAGKPVLLDFHAEWCAPCKWVEPFVEEIAREHQDTLLVLKVDTDAAPGIASRFGVRSIPTLILLREGLEIGRSQGFEPERVRTLIEEVVG